MSCADTIDLAQNLFLTPFCMCSVAQSCLTLCSPMDYSPSGSSDPWDFPGKNTWACCRFLLQGIFPTQGSNSPLVVSLALAGGLFTSSATQEAPHPLLNSGLKMKTNLYDDSQKDLEIGYDLLTLSLFKPFHLLKATYTMERILGIKTKETLVQILALPS